MNYLALKDAAFWWKTGKNKEMVKREKNKEIVKREKNKDLTKDIARY
ncbi:MAG: hypothetical protein ACTSVI_04165 [Promethearchaeota archaeon]